MRDAPLRVLGRADAALNRLYGWRGNPLYMSGVLTVTLLGVVLVTGVYLLLFYRVGAPYQSVAHLTQDVWFGQWTRGLHRYASDAAVVTALIHMVRVWLQSRTWGSRALAWLSGLLLLLLLLICGWTGYVMVWDIQGEVIAREGARWFDVLPLFSEPIARAFDGERAIPGAFFFLNLFAHVALPVGLGVVLWVHVARVARPQLLPPRPLLVASLALLAALAALWPIEMAPAADAFRLPGRAPYDAFFAFFLPVTRPLPPWAIWLAGTLITGLLVALPWLARPRAHNRPLPSVVDERSCTGCEQCYVDCPYEAIAMVPRSDPTDARSALVARVDPGTCTSCGICAGSCAPMGVGPPGRTGKDQLRRVAVFAERFAPEGTGVVIVACDRGSGGVGTMEVFDGAPVYAVACAGNLHSSVVEYFVRRGAEGVLVVSCPPRDCWNREGPRWLEQRLFHGREAELQERVDARRVQLVFAGRGEPALVRAALREFRARLATLGAAPAEAAPEVGAECDVPVSGAMAP